MPASTIASVTSSIRALQQQTAPVFCEERDDGEIQLLFRTILAADQMLSLLP